MFYSQQISTCISKWSYKNNFNSEYISTQCAAPSHDGRIQLACKVAAMLTLTFKLAKTGHHKQTQNNFQI